MPLKQTLPIWVDKMIVSVHSIRGVNTMLLFTATVRWAEVNGWRSAGKQLQ